MKGQRVCDQEPEYKIILNIYRQWKNAQGFSAIARSLNSQRILTRTGNEHRQINSTCSDPCNPSGIYRPTSKSHQISLHRPIENY